MDNLEYIDNYFQGWLLPEEKSRFEKKIAEDPEFAEEVAFYLNLEKITLEQLENEKRIRFKVLYKHHPPPTTIAQPARRTFAYILAAAVVLFIVIGLYFIMQPPTGQKLADRYIENKFKALGVSMSDGPDSLRPGLMLYNEGRLAEAAQLFESVSRLDTSNYTAKKYAGITYLRMNDYERALYYFNQLYTYTDLRANPAKLYLALTHMKRNGPGDKEEAIKLLQQVVTQNLEGKETATQWLKEM